MSLRWKQLSRLFFLLLALPCSPGFAQEPEPDFLISRYGEDPVAGRLELNVRPGEAVNLIAGFYEVGEAKRLLGAEPEGDYRWQVVCGTGDEACAPEDFRAIEHGQTFQVPSSPFREIRIVVTHLQTNGISNRGEFRLKNAELEPHETTPNTETRKPRSSRLSVEAPRVVSVPAPAAKTRAESKPSAPGKASARAAGSSSGGGSGDSGYSRSKRRSSRKHFSEPESQPIADFDRSWGPSFGGGGGSGQSVTTMRGYNRDNTTPVVSCVSTRAEDGSPRLLCEGSNKELRVKAAPQAAGAKAAKKPLKNKAIPSKGPARKAPPAKKNPVPSGKAKALSVPVVALRK